jgi:hypothetical protein
MVTNETEAFAALGKSGNTYSTGTVLFVRMPRFQVWNPLNNSQGTTRGAMIAASKKRKAQRMRTMLEVQTALLKLTETSKQVFFRSPKFSVWLIRVSPREFDKWDGLPASLKAVVDGIADAFETKDDDKRFIWNAPTQAYGGKGVNEIYIVIERRD